ncbi:MAG: potassium-transporting ATPase subunit KdpA, partial [Clostridia bacterium]|nr:potassium-transporting ATPase subunit KdpA [Clostridia bacterium]
MYEIKKVNEKMKKVAEKRGITLIALVVTLIVLLILAGTSIAMLTGENGIINQAQNAKNNSSKAEFEEKVKLAVTASRINEDG